MTRTNYFCNFSLLWALMERIRSKKDQKLMMNRLILIAAAVALLFPQLAAAKKLNVVTSTTDLAALTQEVGGDKINVESIAKGYQDPHFVEAKPSFLLKLKNADLLISVGLDLEIGWLLPLIPQSGNGSIKVEGSRYLIASQLSNLLDNQ